MKRAAAGFFGFALCLVAGAASAGWYQNDTFKYRINFPDSWSVAEDPANDAVRANKPDGSIQTAIQALDLKGQISSADVLADLFTRNVFNAFRFLQKQNDTVNGIPGVAAAYSGTDNGRPVILGAFYVVQPPHGFVMYSVLDQARVQQLAKESDAVFNSFERVTAAAPPSGQPGLGGLLSGAFGAVQGGADPCKQVLGEWKWFTGNKAVFSPDGTMGGNPDHRWSCADPARRIIRVVWSNGKWVDTLTLSADGKRLEGKNQVGNRVWGER